METVVNGWMIEHAGLDVEAGAVIDLVVESGCRYLAPVGYPDALVLGLRIARLGTSSVQWEVGMARESDGEQVGLGRFVHVFVGQGSRRPAAVPEGVRARTQVLVVGEAGLRPGGGAT